MKHACLIFALALAAACTPQQEQTVEEATVAPPPVEPAVADAASEPSTASVQATGVVEEIDTAAGTVTIAHEAIDAYQWPPMTMTFAAPGVDLSGIRQGEHVTFDLTRTGAMEGTITSIRGDQANR